MTIARLRGLIDDVGLDGVLVDVGGVGYPVLVSTRTRAALPGQSEAATLLNVSANTLRSWEQRFSFPTPQRSPGMHRLYLHAEPSSP